MVFLQPHPPKLQVELQVVDQAVVSRQTSPHNRLVEPRVVVQEVVVDPIGYPPLVVVITDDRNRLLHPDPLVVVVVVVAAPQVAAPHSV